MEKPRLGWKINPAAGAKNGQLQTACRILVSSSPEKLAAGEGDLWDSGKMKSGASIHITYQGKPLESMQLCYWKVKVWNNHRQVSAWSEPAMWGAGILRPADWQGKWIGDQPDKEQKAYREYMEQLVDEAVAYNEGKAMNPPQLPSPMLRKTFTAGKEVKRAFLYVSSLGYYEMRINGKRVGIQQLAPEWTDYYERVQYQAYDVTSLLNKDKNVLSALLADGWYLGKLGPVRWAREFPHRGFYGDDRRLMAQLCIDYADGTGQIIATDDSWKINRDGFIRAADNFAGQTIDARKMIPGWDQPDFDDSGWNKVYVDESIDKNLEAQKNEPVQVHHEIRPLSISPWKDKYIVNFGQNFAGWCALKIKGKAGTVVTLRHGEWINDDGSLYTSGLGHAKETDVFILSGGNDSFEPAFTYHGFQYVEISGLDTAPGPDMITGKAVASNPEITGTFECSNPKLNQLFSNILWTQRNNMHSVPTDCPQRDERCGWMGDAQVFCQNSMFNMNMAAFYTKFVKDMRDAIAPNGQFRSIVPSVKHGRFGMNWNGGPAWADAGVIIPWRMYENYADRRMLEEHYKAMKAYIESIRLDNPGLIWKKHQSMYNDWLNANTFSDPPEAYDTTRGSMPDDVFSTAFFAHSVRLTSKAADVLGYREDAQKYSDLADKIAAVFVENFVDEEGRVDGNSQGAYALALHYDLLPENLRSQAFNHMLACLEEYEYRISTGFVTTPMLMKELVRYGRTDIAYQLLESERFPSWIYAINQGATTLWERWDAYVKGRGIHPSDMNSFDHYSIGSVGEWMYRNILGINPDSNSPGYKHLIIHPRPGGSLTWAKGAYNSIHGEISIAWKLEDEAFILTVEIPANTTATLVLPANGPTHISVAGNQGKPMAYEPYGNDISVRLGSGKYEFKVLNPT
jgi:alpha-L-rhamnosidase